MTRGHIVFLLLILIGGAFIVFTLYKQKSRAPLGLSFSPVFQLIGKSTRSTDIALTRMLPIDQMDEKDYGDAIAKEYLLQTDTKDKNYIYLNALIKEVSKFSKKKFNYRVFIVSSPVANAYALPGGVICVTEGLLSTMTSEAQIVSILSHEMGHIERGHCFDAIKFELAFKKIKSGTTGQLADIAINCFLRHSFSKTQENDADEYGYDLLVLTQYDPMACCETFKQLQKQEFKSRQSTIVSDYLDTHPPLPLRIEKSGQNASQWWEEHHDEKRYVGHKNLVDRISMSEQAYENEWIKEGSIL
ncbi:MAG: M48 family metalloprotease [Cytophagales bacterium]|nr:M48 family metalloprotease [Cytophaga sp.]